MLLFLVRLAQYLQVKFIVLTQQESFFAMLISIRKNGDLCSYFYYALGR
jgi:hypothetical protein